MGINLDYQIILDEAPDAILIVNNKLKIIEANKKASELSGYSKAELLTKSLSKLFPKEELENKPFNINEIESNEIVLLERQISTKSGKRIPIEMKSKKLPDGNYYSSFRDISSRIKARDDIQESLNKVKSSEFKYRNLFNNIPLGIFTVHNNGYIESINQSMVKILGSPSAKKSIKFNLFELSTLKGTELLKDLNTCFKTGESFCKIYNYTSVWGKSTYVKGQIFPAEKDNFENALVIIEDYTIQKEKELQLRILSEGVNNSPASVVVTNAKGEISFVNKQFIKSTGYTLDEVRGRTSAILKSDFHTDKFYSELWDTINSGNYWTGEFLNKKKNGTLFWESIMISSLKNEKGEISHFMAIKEDITEKKAVEEKLKLAKEKAEEADLLKSSFLANMSHEIRTPLNAIMGFSSLISDYDIKSNESAKYLDIIQTNGKQLLNIIDDVLFVSKLHVNQIKIYASVFIIDHLLKELQINFTKELELFEEKEIELKIEVSEKVEIEKIETDKSKLNQILTKLIRNAIKFTSKGKISFGYELNDNNEIIFFTKDDGIGISEEKQKIIFQKFRQVDDSDTRQFGGNGLGLSIVKGLIDLLKGKLWVESEEGKGANFYFTIPLEIIKKKKKKKKTSKRKLKWKKKTILIVDDVIESILLIKEILKPSGIKIITASNGIEAIEKFNSNSKINLVLMDIQLPQLNGLETATKIKAKKDIPIIAQSAYLQQEYEKQCKAIGCNEFIQKPINADELMLMLENYI